MEYMIKCEWAVYGIYTCLLNLWPVNPGYFYNPLDHHPLLQARAGQIEDIIWDCGITSFQIWTKSIVALHISDR